MLVAALALGATSLAFALAAPTAQAGKTVDRFFGGFGTAGGQLTDPRGVAVNPATGDVYVAEQFRNRIQRFTASGEFERAWGFDVTVGGATGFEICTVASECKSGEGGAAAGQLDGPAGIAVDPSDGSVYVTEARNRRISKFDADGQFLYAFGWGVDTGASAVETCTTASGCQAAANGSGAGQLGSRFEGPPVAIDPVGGDVIVGDPANRRVQRYGSAGNFIEAFGWGVDTGSDALEACTAASACQQGLAGNGAGQFGADSPTGVAVDELGRIYALDPANARVQRFDGSGASPVEFAPDELSGSGSLEAIAVDAETGRVLVSRQNAAAGEREVVELDAGGSLIDTHLTGAGVAGNDADIGGIALGPSGERLYVSLIFRDVVLVLDADGAAPPTLTVGPPTEVAARSATFHGSVNPNGGAARYRFQYSTNGVTWADAGSERELTGTEPITVSEAIDELEANTFYRVRIVATKSYGGPAATSPELTFSTDVVAPTVTTDATQHRSATGAQLLGSVNANNLPTTYYFEVGTTTAYGARVPAVGASVAGGEDQRVVQSVAELEPATTYHYRLTATNSQGTTHGVDRTFTTRSDIVAPRGRAYEMVTPPDKNNRRFGQVQSEEVLVPSPGTPSPDGESVAVSLSAGILDKEAGTAYPHLIDLVLLTRGPLGWRGEAATNIPSAVSAAGSLNSLDGMSADLKTQAWQHRSNLFSSGSVFGTRVFGDDGGERGSGWYDFLGAPVSAFDGGSQHIDAALIDDRGARMLRWGGSLGGYRGLLGDSDPSRSQLPGEAGGDAIYLQEPPGSGDRELVNECTGTGSAATMLPAIDDKGTVPGGPQAGGIVTITAGSNQVTVNSLVGANPFTVGQVLLNALGGAQFPAGTRITAVDGSVLTMSANANGDFSGPMVAQPNNAAANDDEISVRPCEKGAVTSRRGATVGAGSAARQGSPNPFAGPAATAMSKDGKRVFFMSPDPLAPGVPTAGCTPAPNPTGAHADCTPQLFVRQYNSAGIPTVRWISRTTVPNQRIGLFGRGAGFEGASSDGRYVFFKTNAPLVASDPNGGSSSVTGTPQDTSWDLYRYELPASIDADPAGGTLTRITGGPTGNADPNTVCSGGPQCGADPHYGPAARHVSDDGKRVYFVSAAPITGADATPPRNGTTAPGGTASGNTSSRNLYLFDDTKEGADRWRFIARLPLSSNQFSANACATLNGRTGPSLSTLSHGRADTNCVRATPAGETLVFETRGQLTEDDIDDASDIYLYDAGDDELTRITAPPAGADAYRCSNITREEPGESCNGDLGFEGALKGSTGSELVGLDGYRHANLAIDRNGEVAVYFQSRISLVPEDRNGDHMDVYEWKGGRLALISPGTTDDDAHYSGNSRDGDDVFIYTTQRIDPREIDASDGDIYDARVGGGFPAPPAPPAPCVALADACQGAGIGVPTATRIASDMVGGRGNASPGARKTLGVGKPSRKARRRAALRGVLRVRVRTSRAGLVRVLARAKIGKRTRRVAGRKVRVRKAGAITVKLRLNRAAKRRLRRGRALRVTLRVASPGARTRTATVRLKRGRRS